MIIRPSLCCRNHPLRLASVGSRAVLWFLLRRYVSFFPKHEPHSWYINTGGLLSAGITFGTAKMASTWAWRLPSAMQGFFSVLCLVILPFIPESPRWLVHKGRHAEALESIALAYSNGDRDDTNRSCAVQGDRRYVEIRAWEWPDSFDGTDD